MPKQPKPNLSVDPSTPALLNELIRRQDKVTLRRHGASPLLVTGTLVKLRPYEFRLDIDDQGHNWIAFTADQADYVILDIPEYHDIIILKP